MLQTGTIVGGIYQIVQEIGHGGTGVVYLAYHLNLQKYIVLKRITRQIHNMDSLRREADILKNLRHTNIPQIYDFVIENGEVFTVMDYIEGHSLDEYIGGAGTYSEEQLIRWLRELTDVLVYLGSRHPAVIHSDIKPGNIIITPQGSPVLIDFNISLDQNEAGKIAGFSRNYASPEQGWMFGELAEGRTPSARIDTRTDIYSLGAVFYTLITGIVPDCRYMLARLEDMQGLPYSQAFLAVIDRCTQWNRDDRFRNAGKLSVAVNNLYKMDRNYRRYTGMRVASWIISALIFAAGVYCTLHGVQLSSRVAAERMYSEAAAAAQTGDFTAAGEAASAIIGSRIYSGQLDDEQLAGVYHVLGDSEYVANEYDKAAQYYEKSVELLDNTDSSTRDSYLSDLALTYLRSGDTSALGELASSIAADSSENSDLKLIRAVALAESGDTEGCRKIADEIISSDADSSVKTKACVIAAHSYDDDQIDRQLIYMRRAAELTSNLKYVRECAAMEYAYAGRPGISDYERKAGAERAAKLYSQICRVPAPQMTDLINLGISYYYAGQYEKCMDVLTSAANTGDDYSIRMYQALASEKLGDLSSARNYCSDAINECKKSGRQGWEEDYLTLQELSDRLY